MIIQVFKTLYWMASCPVSFVAYKQSTVSKSFTFKILQKVSLSISVFKEGYFLNRSEPMDQKIICGKCLNVYFKAISITRTF